MGLRIFPKNIPNLNHALFSGWKRLSLIRRVRVSAKANAANIKEIENSFSQKKHKMNPITEMTKVNIPKCLSEGKLVSVTLL